MMIDRPKLFKTASLVITFVFLAFVGWTYATVRVPDHNWPLIRHSLSSNTSWLTRQMVDYEIERRITTGQDDGVMFLTDILAIGFAHEATRGLADVKATSLTEGIIDINSHDDNGYTAIHIAIASNYADVLQWLIDHGADPMISTDLGYDETDDLDAFEYLRFVEQQLPDEDRSELTEVLFSASTMH